MQHLNGIQFTDTYTISEKMKHCCDSMKTTVQRNLYWNIYFHKFSSLSVIFKHKGWKTIDLEVKLERHESDCRSEYSLYCQ